MRRDAGGGRQCRAARGFAFITALFLLVVLGGFAGFIVSLTSNGATVSALAVEGERAYEAAHAGLEWANYQIQDPWRALHGATDTPPDCFASPAGPALPAAFAEFSLTITCERFPSLAATPGYYEEGRRRTAVYVLVATASSGQSGHADYVERRIEARVASCRDPAAAPPAFACS